VDDDSRPIPEWIDVYARRVRAARGDPAELRAVLEVGSVPMMLVDDERRYVYANPPALRLFGRALEELRGLRMDDRAIVAVEVLDSPEGRSVRPVELVAESSPIQRSGGWCSWLLLLA
jgi:PAS domain S-box-containing protein